MEIEICSCCGKPKKRKVGTRQAGFITSINKSRVEQGYRPNIAKGVDDVPINAPATELAANWAGHRYGGQMLKPALESLLIFQKPVVGDMVTSITRTGAGGIWVDGGRIGTDGGGTHCANRNEYGRCLGHNNAGQSTSGETFHGPDTQGGRWPANFSMSHHPDCNGSCVASCPVRRLGEQSGESMESDSGIGQGDGTNRGMFGMGSTVQSRYPGTGTAARFFHQADYIAERIEASDPVGYYAKASRTEREAGLDDMQARIMRDLYGSDETFEDDTIDDGRATPIDNPFQRGKTERKNIHPTIKPIALNRWIATLLLPPERYGPRRLLVPFSGAGSEMIGAMLAGWEEVTGIELEAQHVAIARARIAFWQQMRYKLMNLDAPVKVTSATPVPDGQSTLW